MAVLLVFAVVSCKKSEGPNNGTKTVSQEDISIFGPAVSSQTLKNTVVTAIPAITIEKGKNIIYCSTLQMAWDELKDKVVKEDIRLEPGDAVADSLNKMGFWKHNLVEKEYVARAGFIKDGVVKSINDELKSKFSDQKKTFDPGQVDGNDVIAYSFLFKDLKFKEKFSPMELPISFGDQKTKISAFGILYSTWDLQDVAEQVSIHDYVNDYNFIIKIQPESKEDEIVLAKITPAKDFADTWKDVNGRIKKGKADKMVGKDWLAIPVMRFNIKHNYTNLERKISNKAFTGYSIKGAEQDIMFGLDEKGAIIKSEAVLPAPADAPPPQPKSLLFDRPFLLCLKKKSAEYPYFMMWVDNAELMEKWKQSK